MPTSTQTARSPVEVAIPPGATQPVTCPACQSPVTTPPVERYTAQEAANFFVAPSRNADRNARCAVALAKLWDNRPCEVFECPSCGMGFGWPHKSGSHEFYAITHEQADYPPFRWEYPKAAQHAIKLFPQGGMALDVGAGHGNFAKELPQGWTYFGVESTEVMRKRLEERGHKTFVTLEEAAQKHAGQFSLIVLFQVLEHVAEFDAMLPTLRTLAKPGALLAMSTPYGPEIRRRAAASGCPDMPPNHINRWTPEAVAAAVARAGFRLETHVVQPATAKNVLYTAYLRAIAQAAQHPRSLSGRWYSIKSKKLRIATAPALGAIHLLRMAPRLGDAALSANFLTFSRAV